MTIENTTRVAQIPIEVELADGKIYKLSPLSPVDLAEFEGWIKDDKWKHCLYAGFTDQAEKIKTHLAVLAAPLSEEEYQGYTSSVAGMLKQIWLSLRKLNPDIKEADLDKLVTSENIVYTHAMVDAVGGSGIDPFVRLQILSDYLLKKVSEIKVVQDKLRPQGS